MSLLDFFRKDEGQILEDSLRAVLGKLAEIADPKCSKCFGRGFTGRNVQTHTLVACDRCIRKRKRKLQKERSKVKATTLNLEELVENP